MKTLNTQFTKQLYIIILCSLFLLSSCFFPRLKFDNESYNAFVNDYFQTAEMNVNTENCNQRLYGDFEQQKILYRDSYQRIQPYYDRAREIKIKSNLLIEELETMKKELMAKVENLSSKEVAGYDYYFHSKRKWMDTDISNDYFETDEETGNATRLKLAIADYRNRLLSTEFLFSIRDTSYIKLGFDTESRQDQTWEEFHFDDRFPISAFQQLTLLQYQIRHAENVMLEYTYDFISASSYKFDAIKAEIIPTSYRVEQGKIFEAGIVISAYNTSEKPSIKINKKPITSFTDGKALYSEKATSLGKKKVVGFIQIIDPITGNPNELPFETEYEVIPAK